MSGVVQADRIADEDLVSATDWPKEVTLAKSDLHRETVTLSGFDRGFGFIPGLSLRSNPGLELANAFGVNEAGCELANAFGVNNQKSRPLATVRNGRNRKASRTFALADFDFPS